MANNTCAYGFVSLRDIFAERVTAQNLQTVMDAVRLSTEYYTNQLNSLFGESNFVERTTEYSRRFALSGGGTLQPLDEWGNPLPVREAGYYDLAWPIQGGGTAWGDNRVSRALMTVDMVNRMTLEAQRRDADWMRRHILGAVFDNTTWSFTDRQYGALTVQPLANGDTVTYPRKTGVTSTEDHYLAQASAIDNSNNPYDDLYAELSEHPENSGPYIAYIASDLVATTETLTAFVPVGDPDIALGANSDRLVGAVGAGVGDIVRGKVDQMWIVEWSALPNTYIVAHARGGAPPFRMREYDDGRLQGFFPEMHSPDGNLLEHRFIRYAGFGAWNRIAMAVMRIGNGSYAIPTGFSTPLAA